MSDIQKWKEPTTVRCTVPFRHRQFDESVAGKRCKAMEVSGMAVTKWGRDRSGRSKRLWIDRGLMRMWYTPTVKELQKVNMPIVDINEIRFGRDSTKVFRNANDKTKKLANEMFFFSIVNRNGRSLNLSVPLKDKEITITVLYSIIWTARLRYQCFTAQHFILTAACCSSQYGLTAYGIELIVTSLNHSYPVAKSRNMVSGHSSSRLELTDFEIKLWDMLLSDPIKRLHSCLNPPAAPQAKASNTANQEKTPVRSTTVLLPKALVKFLLHFQHDQLATLQTATELIAKYMLRSQNYENNPEALVNKDIIKGMTATEFQNMLSDVFSNSWIYPEKICDTYQLQEYFVSAANFSLVVPEDTLLERLSISLRNGVKGIRITGLTKENLKKFRKLCCSVRELMFSSSPHPVQIILGRGGGASNLITDYLRVLDDFFSDNLADASKPWTLSSLRKKVIILSELDPLEPSSPFLRIIHSFYTREVVDPLTYFCLVHPAPRMLPGFIPTEAVWESHRNNIINTSSRCVTAADPIETPMWGLGVSWLFMPTAGGSEWYCEEHAVMRSFFEEVTVDSTSQPLVSGYCPKPVHLRKGIPREVGEDHILLIRIPAARFCWKLQKAEVYIECSIHDGLGNVYRSRTAATDNLLTPFWKEVISLVIPNTDHSVLHLKVINGKSPSAPVAEAAALLGQIRLGYRAVPLKDPLTGASLTHSYILIHAAVETRED